MTKNLEKRVKTEREETTREGMREREREKGRLRGRVRGRVRERRRHLGCQQQDNLIDGLTKR